MGLKILYTMILLIALYLVLTNATGFQSILSTLNTVSSNQEMALQGR